VSGPHDQPGRKSGPLVRVLSRFVVVTVLVALFPPAAHAELGQGTVYLERDTQGRYLPSVDNGGNSTVLANIDSITAPARSPDNNRVAFSGSMGDGSLGRYAIYVVNTDGSGLTRITDGAHGEFDPVWIEGGSAIVFSQNTSGSILRSNCCRLVRVDADGGGLAPITLNVGAQRPAASASGDSVFFDNTAGVWRLRNVGGSATLVASGGYDATVSANENWVFYLRDVGSSTQLRRVSSTGGSSLLLYSTTNELENPVWLNGRVYFLEHGGLGYDGRGSVVMRSVSQSGGSLRAERTFWSGVVGVTPGPSGEEILFYRDDGLFRYYNIRPDGSLPSPLSGGDNYTRGWSSIASVDLDGNGDDEMFFYREDGLFRYYDIRSNGSIPSPTHAGDNYTRGWDAITAVDLDGDGQDEMFFYRSDGLFRYYDIRPDGTIPKPMTAGSNYTQGWDSITAVDLNGDGRDEMFFYRSDGLYRFYPVTADGRIGQPIRSGSNFPSNLAWVSAIDLDGDDRDELLLYRSNGSYEYRNLSSSGALSSVIRSGTDYTNGWTIITSVKLPPS